MSGLRLYPAGRGADRGASEGARHCARTDRPRRAACAAAEQALRHGGGTGRACSLPGKLGRCLDHRRGLAGRWRLDRALERAAPPTAIEEEDMRDVSSARPIERGKEETEEKSAQERQIVLVFQGGGALGAYQAGVYQALHESGIEPD